MVSPQVFFQRHWDLLKDDLAPAVFDFLNGGELSVGMNDTTITLIAKEWNPQYISQYRPISLCQVIYKIAAESIFNRMRGMLDEVIGEKQSAFVLG
jgi:hypothetical protein